MKVTEAKYTRRYNTGNYEHEEFSLAAMVEDNDSHIDVMLSLKADVQKAYSGEAQATQAEEQTTEESGSGRGRGKGRSKQKETAEQDIETAEESEDEIEEEIEEDGTGSEEVAEDETEEAEEEKKPKSKPGEKTKSPGKGFKKKPQVYQRSNETHKELFSKMLNSAAPNWKKSFESKAHAKKVSQKMEGVEFLDENGKVLEDFKKQALKLMGKFK